MTRALVLQHARTGPPAVLGAWLDARAIPFDVHDASTGEPLPALDAYTLLASLGAAASPNDVDRPEVAAEEALTREAVARDIPVLGLCFGGQMLAKVLGGAVERAPRAELGWQTIHTVAPHSVPAGPWLTWHYDRFITPPGAQLLAWTEVAPQAFQHGRHFGTQFHPESTLDIVRVWSHKDRAKIAAHGVDDPDALLDAGAHHAEQAYSNAFALFDGFLARARAGDESQSERDRSISA
ncbi:MAG TPA: type 1 glutamine amidotransferase [Baekduia sp.]